MSMSMQAAPERPLAPSPRVPWRARWRLHRAARSDRRAGLPVGLSPDTTPVLAELVALYGHACERERTAYLAEETELSVRLRRLETQIEALDAGSRRRAAEVERLTHPTAEAWLATRFPGEEFLPSVATRTRRAVAHQRQLAQAQAEYGEAQLELEQALADRAEVAARLRRQAEIARSRVQRHRELTERMASIYRRTLVKRHPEREALIGRWSTGICTSPDWALELAALPSEASTEVPA
jgi:hypothetical protein